MLSRAKNHSKGKAQNIENTLGQSLAIKSKANR